jgi:hypothetical protein
MGKEITMEDKKVITGKFRVSFPQLFKAKSFKGQEPKFGITMLFPKNEDGIKALKRAAMAAAEEKWAGKAESVIAKIKGGKGWPFRDGDKEKPDMKGYAGHYFVNAKAKETNKPGVVDRKREPILDESEVYAGCYARASVIAYAYDNDFGKGIGFSLQNVQKLADGEKFSGKKDAESEFDAVDDESDDETNYSKTDDEEEDDLGF